MSEEATLETVAGFLEDATTRAILAETSVEPMTVTELADCVPASKPTIYRRIERLERLDLVRASIQPADDGHQERVYWTTFDELTVSLEDGSYSWTLQRDEPMADRLTRFVEQL